MDLDDVQRKTIRDVVKECPPPESHEMQQNTTHCDNLSTAQQMALNAILVGQNMTQAASAAGVDRSTLHRWFRDDLEFVATVNRGKRDVHEAMQARLLAMTEKAVDRLEISIENGNEKSA